MSRYRWDAPGGELRFGPLAVRTLGVGRPVLLLHGLGGSHRYWGAAYDELGQNSRLVAPDMLGFGSSPKPAAGYTVGDHLDALVATFDWLGIDEPVVVGAHSIGTLLALALAARHPERVAGIVAVGPPIYPDPDTARRCIAQIGWLETQLAYGRPAAERTCRFTYRYRRLSTIVARLVRRRLPTAVVTDGLKHTWASYSQTFASFILAAPGDSWIAATRTPIRLVAGQQDRVLDHQHLESVVRLHDHVSLEVVAGADHDLPLAQPDIVLRELRAICLRART